MKKNSIKVLLVSLANMYSGNWDYMYKHIALNKKYNYEEALKSFSNIKSNVITIMDSDLYPKEFNQILHPPFVLFYYGNISLLKNKNKYWWKRRRSNLYNYRFITTFSSRANAEEITKHKLR